MSAGCSTAAPLIFAQCPVEVERLVAALASG
jgi:hypothetical protein